MLLASQSPAKQIPQVFQPPISRKENVETAANPHARELGLGAPFIGEALHGLEVCSIHHPHSFSNGDRSIHPYVP